ncbi:MAG: hypothetical protein LUF00_13545 [Lachnospiraceae bacterium]|nr:hypothetical protein [Lachnospiraceae bacterium]
MGFSKRYLYVLLSSTGTKFAKMIRLVGRQTYNHAAVSLDGDLEHLYAFARPQQDAIFLGHLVRESLERYTLRQSDPVPVVILRIPISQEGYDWVTRRITQMVDNTEYMYNLLSVLSYPVTGGITVDKTYTCVEFATHLLQYCGYLREMRCCYYTPDDLVRELSEYVIYRGDIRDCLPDVWVDYQYFSPPTLMLFLENMQSLLRLIRRTVKF